MQAVIFVGIQASGKSTFYLQEFFRTHIRINLDMLKTRHREDVLIRACLDAKQSFVVDNTNPTVKDRAKYIKMALDHEFEVVGYYFQSKLVEAIERNAKRSGEEHIPEKGVRNTYNRLVIPAFKEGFHKLYYVRTAGEKNFSVEEWKDEV
jgi:predicted kinase